MSVDLRTRRDGEGGAFDAAEFFGSALPRALETHAALIGAGVSRMGLGSFTIETSRGAWTLDRAGDRVRIRAAGGGAVAVRLDDRQLADLVLDQATPVAFYTSGALDMPRTRLGEFLDWWLVLRGAIDGRPIHVPGAVGFRAPDGGRLDLRRAFTLDDDEQDLRHFLEEAGFLHLRGVFSAEEMGQVSADMDRAASSYSPDDGNSWWATTADGAERLVRMQAFDRESSAAAAILADDRFLRIGRISGDGHAHTGLEGNRIEALVKPIGVVRGISDLPWHKDCSLGRHSYECCSLTVGISVTGADAESGQLHVYAGSHRALVRPSILPAAGIDLPDLALPTRTGDVTVHLSCTLHMAEPPRQRERRVMYTSFRLPTLDPDAAVAGRARLRAARESAPVKVSQPPAGAASR